MGFKISRGLRCSRGFRGISGVPRDFRGFYKGLEVLRCSKEIQGILGGSKEFRGFKDGLGDSKGFHKVLWRTSRGSKVFQEIPRNFRGSKGDLKMFQEIPRNFRGSKGL